LVKSAGNTTNTKLTVENYNGKLRAANTLNGGIRICGIFLHGPAPSVVLHNTSAKGIWQGLLSSANHQVAAYMACVGSPMPRTNDILVLSCP